MGQLDVDGDNCIQWSECLAATMGAQLLRNPEAVQDAFDTLDLNKDERIDHGELVKVLGKSVCGQDVSTIFQRADENSDGSIDFDEFKKAVAPRRSVSQDLGDGSTWRPW